MTQESLKKILNAYKYAKSINERQDIWKEMEYVYSCNSNLKNQNSDFYNVIKQFEGKTYGELYTGKSYEEVGMEILVPGTPKNVSKFQKIILELKPKVECLNTFLFLENDGKLFLHKSLSEILHYYLLFKFKHIIELFKIEKEENFEFTYEGILNDKILKGFYEAIKKKYDIEANNDEQFNQLMEFFEISKNIIVPKHYLSFDKNNKPVLELVLELRLLIVLDNLKNLEVSKDKEGREIKRIYNFDGFELV